LSSAKGKERGFLIYCMAYINKKVVNIADNNKIAWWCIAVLAYVG
jgi:hypothetical protein